MVKINKRIAEINASDPHGRRLTKSVFIRSIVERKLEDGSDG